MNEIVRKFLLLGDKFMPEMHLLRKLVDHLLKIKKEYKNFKKTRDSMYVYQNKLDKARFQHDMTYGDFNDLPRRAASDKLLRDKTLNIDKNPKYGGYLLHWFISFLIKSLQVVQ